MPNLSFSNTRPSLFNPAIPERQTYLSSRAMSILFLMIGLQFIVGFLTYETSLTFDEAMWQYIGRNWFRNGLIPYSGGVDNKSPLIFAVYGLSDKLFGVNYWFPRLLGICFQSAGLYYVYKIARHLSSERAGLIALIIYGFSILWHGSGGKYVSYTESYAVAFTIMAVYYIIAGDQHRSFFIAGVLAALGFMFRISALFGFLAFVSYLLSQKKSKALLFIAGFLAAVLFTCTLLSISGIRMHDIFTFALLDNFGPGSVTDHPLVWKMNNFFSHFFNSELVLFFPGLIGYCFIKKRNNIFLLWFVFEFTGLMVPGIFSLQHFKSLLPSLSLMSAFSVAWLLETYSLPVKQTAIVVLISFFPKISEPFFSLKNLLHSPEKSISAEDIAWSSTENDHSKKLLGLWISSNTDADTRVFIAGYSAIAQAYSERRSPSIYFNVTQTGLAKEIFFKEMSTNKPGMICIPSFPDYARNVDADIHDYVAQLSTRDYVFKKYLYGYNIYIKRDQLKL